MYQIYANEIGFEFEPDVLIKINREPLTQREWEYVSRFVDETMPPTSDEISHGYSTTSCFVYLPNTLAVTEAAAEANCNRSYIKAEITHGNLRATKIGNQYAIARADFDAWMHKPRRGSRRTK